MKKWIICIITLFITGCMMSRSTYVETDTSGKKWLRHSSDFSHRVLER